MGQVCNNNSTLYIYIPGTLLGVNTVKCWSLPDPRRSAAKLIKDFQIDCGPCFSPNNVSTSSSACKTCNNKNNGGSVSAAPAYYNYLYYYNNTPSNYPLFWRHQRKREAAETDVEADVEATDGSAVNSVDKNQRLRTKKKHSNTIKIDGKTTV